jgi:hypothetical protein
MEFTTDCCGVMVFFEGRGELVKWRKISFISTLDMEVFLDVRKKVEGVKRYGGQLDEKY